MIFVHNIIDFGGPCRVLRVELEATMEGEDYTRKPECGHSLYFEELVGSRYNKIPNTIS